MSAKAIREATGKDLLNRLLAQNSGASKCQFASVDESTNWQELVSKNSWLKNNVSDFCDTICLIFFFYLNIIITYWWKFNNYVHI